MREAEGEVMHEAEGEVMREAEGEVRREAEGEAMHEAEGEAIIPRRRWVVAKVASQTLNRREEKVCAPV
jgi:hypothetical protein